MKVCYFYYWTRWTFIIIHITWIKKSCGLLTANDPNISQISDRSMLNNLFQSNSLFTALLRRTDSRFLIWSQRAICFLSKSTIIPVLPRSKVVFCKDNLFVTLKLRLQIWIFFRRHIFFEQSCRDLKKKILEDNWYQLSKIKLKIINLP